MMVETLPPEKNFLALEPDLSNFQKSQAVILPVPYEASTTLMEGTQKGPEAILAVSSHLEDYDDELDVEPCSVGIATLPPVNFEGVSGEEALKRIEIQAYKVYHTGKFLLALGGEHTITVPLVRAAYESFDRLSVLLLDAHSDLYPEYQGSKYNHACTAARIHDVCDFVGIGIRSSLKEQEQQLRPASRLYYANDMVRDPDWPEKVLDQLSDTVYLSIDLDFFDPAVMPAVGTPEPGGFLWYESLEFLRLLFENKNVVACDVVELCPVEGLIHPNIFAAKLVYKLIAYRFFARISYPEKT